MVKTYRSMKFHRLRMYRFTANSDTNSQKFLSVGEEQTVLKNCINVLPGNHDFKEFRYKNKSIAVEFISGVNDYLKGQGTIITGKLSSAKDEHAYQIRKSGTDQDRNVTVTDQERFECRSYFVIDTEDMIIAYLSEQSAPSVYSIGEFVQLVSKNDNTQTTTFAQVTDIAIKDMIENLSKMSYIGTVTEYLEIPTNMPEEVTGLSEEQYKDLSNQKTIRMQIGLVTDRRGVSAFEGDNNPDASPEDRQRNENDKKAFFKGLSANQFLKKIKVKAKPFPDDHIQEMWLNNNPLVYQVGFDYGQLMNANFDTTICQLLKNEYSNHEDEIKDQYRD